MKALVKKFKLNKNTINKSVRDQLILDFSPLIKFVAQKIVSRLPANIEIDDLISAGVIGLMDAIEKYDPTRDNKFKTYAEFRIRGSMLDELRAQDWVPRSIRDKAKVIDRAFSKLEQEFGRSVTGVEISTSLGISIDQYYMMLHKIRASSMLSVEDLSTSKKHEYRTILECLESSKSRNPFLHVRSKDIRNALIYTIDQLPDKQKLVMSLYYYEDLNLKEIGRILDVTESRVSQLHTQALSKMKIKLKDLLVD
ncbi:MAG: FliA/WhiG family RNA polymerase sigma factor [Zetaproteobacteria bacterium]|nr:FliA/WhiG family RNA polymerase sigma factor [Pseudobdellovibrionaceae bacterium]